MIVAFRSPHVAIAIFRSLVRAQGKRLVFLNATPASLTGSRGGEAAAAEQLRIDERRRELAGKRPRGAMWRWWFIRSMAMKYAALRAMLVRRQAEAAFVWNGERGRRHMLAQAARDLSIPTLIFEHAPIPGRLTIDPAGVNARASVPREPEFFRLWAAEHGTVDWRREGETLKARRPRKAGQPAASTTIPDNYIFLPLQVATDTQILLNGRWVPSIREMLLAAIRQIPRLPEGWALVVKEHPSCRIKNADVLRARAQSRLVVSEAEDTFALVRGAGGVLTLNSSVGLQSFFFDKPVCVLGDAFYRQPGLVEMADSEEELGNQFARAGDWSFDSELRDAFMSWLCDEYYVPIDEKNPTVISERALAMVRRMLGEQTVS